MSYPPPRSRDGVTGPCFVLIFLIMFIQPFYSNQFLFIGLVQPIYNDNHFIRLACYCLINRNKGGGRLPSRPLGVAWEGACGPYSY